MRALPAPTSSILIGFVLLAAAAGASAQTSLTILVRDAETQGPLPGARLEVGGVVGTADAFGTAELVGMEPGPLDLAASFIGYVALDTTVTILGGVPTVVTLPLASDARQLGDVVVEAESVNDAVLRRRGFFDRRESLTGVFITRDELDRRGATLLSDAFRGVAGVRVQRDRGVTSLVSTRRRGCRMAIYVDGTEAVFLADAVDGFPYDDVAAIEIYRGPAEVPIEYTRTKGVETCGAILVWTQIVTGE